MLDGQRVVRAASLAGGYRNDNTLLLTDRGGRYVLRRYRHGAACAVEGALVRQVSGVVPVAEVVAHDPDGARAGEPVLLSQYVPGRMVSEVLAGLATELPDLTQRTDQAWRLGAAAGGALARLGTVTFPSGGFFTGADLVPAPVDGSGLPEFVDGCLRRRHPDHALTEAECASVRSMAERSAGALASVADARQLVHADFNPKNLLVGPDGTGWTVTAVLDWEFAFSGSPLFDVGNMLRFGDDDPPGFADGFLAGFVEAGGHLPPDWREVSRALDLYSLAEFVTAPASEVSLRAVALLLARAADPPGDR